MTPRQQQARDLRASGLTWAEAGKRMGITGQSARINANPSCQLAYTREMVRALGRCTYPVEHAADWWLAQDDPAEVLRVETSA